MQIARISVVEGERGAEREPLAEGTTIRIDNQATTVEILNLSRSGCLIRSPRPLQPDMKIRIGLRGAGSFAAKVVRVDGTEAGCQFDVELDQATIARSFSNNVVFIGDWDPAAEAAAEPEPEHPLSARVRLLIIAASALGLWAAIIAIGSRLFF